MAGNRNGKKGLFRRKAFWVVLVLAVLAVLGLRVLNRARANMAELQRQLLDRTQEAVVTRGTIRSTVDGNGNLEVADSFDVLAPTGIRVDTVEVEAGEEVEAGDVIARLNVTSIVEALVEIEDDIKKIDDELKKDDKRKKKDDEKLSELKREEMNLHRQELVGYQEELLVLRENPVIIAGGDGVISEIRIEEGAEITKTGGSVSGGSSSTDFSAYAGMLGLSGQVDPDRHMTVLAAKPGSRPVKLLSMQTVTVLSAEDVDAVGQGGEDEAMKKAAEEAQKQAEEEAKRLAEQAQKQAEEEAKKLAEQQAKEVEAAKAAAEQQAAAEESLKQAAEAQQAAPEESLKQAAESAAAEASKQAESVAAEASKQAESAAAKGSEELARLAEEAAKQASADAEKSQEGQSEPAETKAPESPAEPTQQAPTESTQQAPAETPGGETTPSGSQEPTEPTAVPPTVLIPITDFTALNLITPVIGAKPASSVEEVWEDTMKQIAAAGGSASGSGALAQLAEQFAGNPDFAQLAGQLQAAAGSGALELPYTSKITWKPSSKKFKEGKKYKATIRMKAKEGFTFEGFSENMLPDTGAKWSSSLEDGGRTLVLKASYPKLESLTSQLLSGMGLSGKGLDLSGFHMSGLNLGGFDTSALSGITGQSLTGNSVYSNYRAAVCTVNRQENVKVSIRVDEEDILSVEEGQEAELVLDALPGQTFTGTITKVFREAEAGNGSAKFAVEITVPKTEDMRIGMSASADITVGRAENVPTLPITALQQSGETTFVYTTRGDDGTLGGETEVVTGLSDGTNVEIVSGLAEGDTVYFTRTGEDLNPFGFGGGFGSRYGTGSEDSQNNNSLN